MTSGPNVRFAIRFDAWYRVLSSVLFLSPADSFLEVSADAIDVRMAWGFQAHFPRAAVMLVVSREESEFSRGVHGWDGRWLVNGSSRGIVALHLQPSQRARVMGASVALRELRVSVEDPQGLLALLTRSNCSQP